MAETEGQTARRTTIHREDQPQFPLTPNSSTFACVLGSINPDHSPQLRDKYDELCRA